MKLGKSVVGGEPRKKCCQGKVKRPAPIKNAISNPNRPMNSILLMLKKEKEKMH